MEITSFSEILVDLEDGTDLLDEKGMVLTLGLVCVRALTFNYPDEGSLSGMEKYDRGKLARRIRKASTEKFYSLKIDAEQVALLKKLIAKAYGPKVVLPAFDLLEGNSLKAVPD